MKTNQNHATIIIWTSLKNIIPPQKSVQILHRLEKLDFWSYYSAVPSFNMSADGRVGGLSIYASSFMNQSLWWSAQVISDQMCATHIIPSVSFRSESKLRFYFVRLFGFANWTNASDCKIVYGFQIKFAHCYSTQLLPNAIKNRKNSQVQVVNYRKYESKTAWPVFGSYN